MTVRVALALPRSRGVTARLLGFYSTRFLRLTCWIFKYFIALSVYFHMNGERGLQ